MKNKGTFDTIVKMLIIFVVIGFLSAMVDYFRMKTGEIPIFSIKKYDEKTKIQTFRGIFYKAERKTTSSEKESLVESSEIKFAILVFKLDVPKQFKEIKLEYNVITKETDTCQESAKLYYADKNIKVYTYCLDEIKISKENKAEALSKYLQRNSNIIDELDSELTYMGQHTDRSTLMFKDTNNMSNNGLTMYKCNKENINDIYIGPANTVFQQDFCTYKDDDFKFIYTIVEEPKTDKTQEAPKEKEVIYEGEKYRYEFDEIKSNRIYIVTPAVRGKEEMRYPLKNIITSNILTMDELAEKGLKFNKIDKVKEQEELLKAQKDSQ